MKKLETKFAPSPTLEGIKKAIARFYGGEEKTVTLKEPGLYEITSPVTGKVLSTVVVEDKRGFYFGAL